MSKRYPEGCKVYMGDEEHGDLCRIHCDKCGAFISEYYEELFPLSGFELNRFDWCDKCAPRFKVKESHERT